MDAYTVADAMAVLEISKRKLYYLIKSGELEKRHIKRKGGGKPVTMITAVSVGRYMKEMEGKKK